MLLYVAIWCYLLFCSFIKRNTIIMWYNIFILSLIAGFRDTTIGADTFSYYLLYGYIAENNVDYIEPGWYFLNYVVNKIAGDNSYNLLLWLVSLLTLLPIGYIAKKNTPNPSLALFLYYSLYAYLHSFNIMRQMLAISFVLLSYFYLERDNIKKYIILLIIAISIHYTALFSLIILFVRKIEISKYRIYFFCFVSLILGFILNSSFFSVFAGKYANYLSSSQYGFRDLSISNFILTILLNILFIFIFLTYRKIWKKNLFMKIYFIGIIILNLTSQLALGTRLILYFTLIQCFIFPSYFLHNRIKEKFIIRLLIVCYVFIFFLKILLLGNEPGTNGVYPYKTFFA